MTEIYFPAPEPHVQNLEAQITALDSIDPEQYYILLLS